MKSFKKALAVFLSVLMVAFSFPLSAFALYNENNDGYAPGEEYYATDYDVEVHAYVTNYDDEYAYGYSAGTVEFFDPTQPLKKSDLSSPDGCFAIIITVENLDDCFSSSLMFDVDWDKVTPANYGRRGLSTGPDSADLIETGKDYGFTFDQTGSSAYGPGPNGHTLYVSTNWLQQDPVNYTQQPYCEEGYDGMVLGVYGYQMLTDEINLQEVFKLHVNDYDSFFRDSQTYEPSCIVPYGAVDAWGEPSPYTKFIFPEWGITGPEEPGTEVTYTYTFADGKTEQVTAAEGKEPVAPPNTANTAAKSNDDGTHTYTTYSWPKWVEGTTEYTEVATPVTDSCNMEEIEPAVDPIHSDGKLVDGKTAVMQCKDCGYKTGGEVIPAGEHDYQLNEELSTPATCMAGGEDVYVCSVCGDKMTKPTEKDPSNHTNVVTDEAVAATCTDKGLTEGSHCADCGATIVKQEEVPALGHDYQITASTDATCITPGSVTYTCSRCKDTYTKEGVLNPENHEGEIVSADNAVAPTRGEDGKEADKICSACGATVEEGAVIPALGVQITVQQNELGATTLNGEATTGEAQKVVYKDSYTLVATANEGAEFVGWQVNGKLVSTNATYTTAAYADLTYVPVFAEKADDFTVTFVDQFNMVLGTYTSSQIADLEAMPATYNYLGYTFADWSMTLEEVKALDANAIVTANYTKNDALTYTVSAPGCTITVGDAEYKDTAEVAFDQAVTVAPTEGTATAWTVNGNNAAYGSEYTFFVTSDVEVAYTSDEVTAVPTVAGVDATAVGDGSVRFLATRNVPAGYTLLESGYLYGKDYEDAEASLVLENANNTCSIYKNSNTAADGQFALTFKITAQTGVAYARAYVIAADAEGNAAVYYGNVQSFDYDA